jgi:predicted AlkP superfamily pyrophosphatase or phosphodiesterase
MNDTDFRGYDLSAVAATVAGILNVEPPPNASGPIEPVLAGLPGAERLALLVVDGFGSSVWQGVRDHVPVLNRLREVNHTEISSVVPSYTYICLSTMLTGVSPAGHGVTGLQGMVQAARSGELETVFDSVRRAGGESLLAVHRRDVEGVPVDRFAEHTMLAEEREDTEIYARVPGILQAHRPMFAFVHFLDVDEAAHAFGPASPEVADAASRTDSRLGVLLGELAREGYAVLLLADHGQHASEDGPDEEGNLGVHDGSCEEDLRVPLVWASAQDLRGLVASRDD